MGGGSSSSCRSGETNRETKGGGVEEVVDEMANREHGLIKGGGIIKSASAAGGVGTILFPWAT